MAEQIFHTMLQTIAGDLVGSSLVFGLAVLAIIFIMLSMLRMPANLTFAFIFPVIIAFTLVGYFPIWIKAIAAIIEGTIWFLVIKSLILE